jgi:hypothetical protein
MATLIKKVYQLDSKFESVKFQIIVRCFSNKDFHFTENELNVLTLFYIDGVNSETVNKCLQHQFFKNEQTVKNFMSKLIKLKILKRVRKNERVIDNTILDITVDDVILMDLKIGNSN